MARLIYSAIMSLDGYVADDMGSFAWAAPNEEVHTFVNDMERTVGAYLYGRRMCEVMVAWETMGTLADEPLDPGEGPELAGSREDRVLHDAGDGAQRQDAHRATSTPRRSGRWLQVRGVTSAWVAQPGRPGDQGRTS